MTEEEAIAKAIAQRNQLDDEINRLQNANKNIQPEEINAAAERKKVSDALGNIKKWKGTTYNTIEELGLREKYYFWVNSIDIVIDTIYSASATKQDAREAICNWYGF